MIEGIDIFQPRENGLPDFSRISPGQIFNGSVAAAMNGMKDSDPLGLLKTKAYEGVSESTRRNTTIDPNTGKRVEVRKASVVQEILGGNAASGRGHSRINGGGGGGGYSAPNYVEPGPLPEDNTALPDGTGTGEAGSLLDPTPGWHPPMSPDYSPPSSLTPEGSPSLFPPEFTPEEAKTASLNRLPTMLLEELKNLHLV